MLWNKTSCSKCHGSAACSEKTKVYINYCGSQRERNKTQYMLALTECRSHRGLNYINIKTNIKPPETQYTEFLEPIV